MKKREFKKKIDEIICAETPEIQAKLINALYRTLNTKQKKPKTPNNKLIGVLCYDINDFLSWKNSNNFEIERTPITSNIVKYLNGLNNFTTSGSITYFAIKNLNDIRGKFFSGFIETPKAFANMNYSTMREFIIKNKI